MINLIASVGLRGEIGFNETIPWLQEPGLRPLIEEQQRWWTRMTGNDPILVGSNTYKELAAAKMIKGREILVWSRSLEMTPGEFIEHQKQDYGTFWICGGAKTFELFSPYAQNLYIARVPWTGAADRWLKL